MNMSPSMQNTEPESILPKPSASETVHVAVAVIERVNSLNQREILIAKRSPDAHQGGLWEFPGGKVELGESVTEALVRELYEELDIVISSFQPLIQIKHHYTDKCVMLDVWRVDEFEGEAKGKEGQPIQWVRLENLSEFSFPEANLAIIKACRLSRHFVITPEYTSLEVAKQNFRLLLDQGHQLYLLRQASLDIGEYQKYAVLLLECFPELSEMLLLSGDPVRLKLLNLNGMKVKGIHSPFRYIKNLCERPLSAAQCFGVSCHNEHEIQHAQKIGADYITLSPVQLTVSHPEARPLGWQKFRALIENCNIPAYALGGLKLKDVQQAIDSGAQGIAGIRLWQS